MHIPFLILSIFLSIPTLAYDELCIGSRFFDDLFGPGHAFISIRHDQRVIATLGFWPAEDDVLVGMGGAVRSSVDKVFYFPSEFKKLTTEYYGLKPTEAHKLKQASYCLKMKITPEILEKMDKYIKNYKNKYGDWTIIGNNFVMFATRFFSKFSGESVHVLGRSPRALYMYIREAQSRSIALGDVQLNHFDSSNQSKSFENIHYHRAGE